MNNTEQEFEVLESSIEHWMLGDFEDAKQNLGEDICAAVKEVLDYE